MPFNNILFQQTEEGKEETPEESKAQEPVNIFYLIFCVTNINRLFFKASKTTSMVTVHSASPTASNAAEESSDNKEDGTDTETEKVYVNNNNFIAKP